MGFHLLDIRLPLIALGFHVLPRKRPESNIRMASLLFRCKISSASVGIPTPFVRTMYDVEHTVYDLLLERRRTSKTNTLWDFDLHLNGA